jgi:hypothetical protein
VDALRQRLLNVFAGRVIELAQSRMPGFDLDNATASCAQVGGLGCARRRASVGPTRHVLDWFHLAMRTQRVAQAAKKWPDATLGDSEAAFTERLSQFGLAIHKGKTRLLKVGAECLNWARSDLCGLHNVVIAWLNPIPHAITARPEDSRSHRR